MDLGGLEHEGPQGETMTTFEDCMMLILKIAVANNTAEDMKFYMTCLNPMGWKFACFHSEQRR
jgi:hypothetical protein